MSLTGMEACRSGGHQRVVNPSQLFSVFKSWLVLRNIQKLYQKLHNLDDKIRKAFWLAAELWIGVRENFQKTNRSLSKKNKTKKSEKNWAHFTRKNFLLFWRFSFLGRQSGASLLFHFLSKTKQNNAISKRATESKDSEMRKISITLFSREFERVFLFPTQKKKIFHLVVAARSEKIKKSRHIGKKWKKYFNWNFVAEKSLEIKVRSSEMEWSVERTKICGYMCKKISKQIQISAEKNQWKFAIFGNQKNNKKIEKWFWGVSGTDFPIFVCFSANFVEKIPTQKVEISVQKSVIKKKIRQDRIRRFTIFKLIFELVRIFCLKFPFFWIPRGHTQITQNFNVKKSKNERKKLCVD